MNNSIFESIFAVFDDKPPFLSILDTFWPIFGHFSYSTSINHSLTIELNNILNWITRVYFELNNILNWILGKAILNRILNESFFGKIQTLNWIKLGIGHPYQAVHHCIKCLISVLGRALFFYQDFHFDFLLQYSLSYCWEDRPVSKEKPRSIRCFFFHFCIFFTFGGWNFNHVAQKILIKRAFLRIFFFWDQLNFSLSGVFKRRAI